MPICIFPVTKYIRQYEETRLTGIACLSHFHGIIWAKACPEWLQDKIKRKIMRIGIALPGPDFANYLTLNCGTKIIVSLLKK